MTNNRRCQRHRNIDAIARSSIHQSLATPSSQMAMARTKSSTLSDPKQALDLVRSLIQSDLNEKIQFIMQEYVDAIFQPAIDNIRQNIGDHDLMGPHLLQDVCCSALEHAKSIFKTNTSSSTSTSTSNGTETSTGNGNNHFSTGNGNNHSTSVSASLATRMAIKRKLTTKSSKCHAKKRALSSLNCRSDLALMTSEGKPIRREGPKWDTKRINHETLFLLGVKASRLLGYKRGSRLYAAHPTLFKYTLDQEDRDRLVEAGIISQGSSCKKINILVAEDIIEIAENMEIKSNEILRHAFKCPPGMIDKMKIFMDLVKTDPEESDELLLKKVGNAELSDIMENSGIKTESGTDPNVSDEDLGFLQNMNLTSLVREFEMEAASGQGSQNLGILSLADDGSENPFSDLEDHHQNTNGNMTDSLNDIEFE